MKQKILVRAKTDLEKLKNHVALIEDWIDNMEKGNMTCEGCVSVDTCNFAWDIYNTYGDCLVK